MAKYDLHGGGGATQAAGEAIARQTLQQIKFETGQLNSEPPEQPAEKTLPGYGPMPAERLRALAERQSAPGERIALVPPSAEKVAAASAALVEQTKQAEGALVKTLTGNGESKEAAVAKAKINQIPMMAMFAGRIHTLETGAALQKIDRIAKPAEVSVDALKTTSQDTPITWQGVKDAASFLAKCTKIGVGAYLGAGVVNMIGVGAALTVGKYYAMGVGVEAVYRTYQARKEKKPIKGTLPGTEWAAKKLNTFLDNPRKVIGEAFMKISALRAEAGQVAREKRTSRVAELATAAGKPEVVAQVKALDAERTSLVTTLDQGVGPTSPFVDSVIDTPDPLSTTIDFGGVPQMPVFDDPRTSLPSIENDVMNGVTKTLDVPESIIRGKIAQVEAGTKKAEDLDGRTVYAGIELSADPTLEDPNARQRDNNLQKIAIGGVEAAYEVLPSMKKEAMELDKEFVLDTDPDADKLSDHLSNIADEAVSLRLLAKSIADREAVSVLDLNLPQDKEMFAGRAGTMSYADFNPEAWALSRLKSLGEDGPLAGVQNAKGEAVVGSKPVKDMLTRLVGTVVMAQKITTG